MTPEVEQQLMREAARGERAKDILGHSCWAHDIKPYMEKRAVDLTKGSAWKPNSGPADVEVIALGAAYNGGREDECLNLVTQMNIWVEQGRLAAEKLEKNKEKR